jgi:hypothetical protein
VPSSKSFVKVFGESLRSGTYEHEAGPQDKEPDPKCLGCLIEKAHTAHEKQGISSEPDSLEPHFVSADQC